MVVNKGKKYLLPVIIALSEIYSTISVMQGWLGWANFLSIKNFQLIGIVLISLLHPGRSHCSLARTRTPLGRSALPQPSHMVQEDHHPHREPPAISRPGESPGSNCPRVLHTLHQGYIWSRRCCKYTCNHNNIMSEGGPLYNWIHCWVIIVWNVKPIIIATPSPFNSWRC